MLTPKAYVFDEEPFEIKPFHMGRREELKYDDVESLIEFGEGESHR
jgi:hypothetical protein